MANWVRRSILRKSLVVIACVFYASLGSAQHGPTRVIGGAPHVSAPPISRGPIYSAPAYRPPSYAPRPSAMVPSYGMVSGFRPPINPIRPIRPLPPVIVYYPFPFGPTPFWAFNSCWWGNCNFFWTLGYVSVPYYQYSPANYVLAPQPQYEPPIYGQVSPEMPRLFLKDGSVLSVTDYWVVDDRLHFKMVEYEGAKPVEHDIPFDQLDLQKTIDANTARGFNFMLRNEPFEQYVRDHPDPPPGDVSPPHD